jgi:ParB family transcriptional regulator, chromosome partitioning protein
MSRRRDDLKALFAGEPAAEAAPEQKALIPRFLRGEAPSPAVETPAPRAASGALKAMGLELDGLRNAASEVERLKAALASSVAVVEIAAELIDAAFVRDRMAADRDADQMLEASIAANGQQVPVLVRPHPVQPGRYEAVYGHRRVAALKRLGKPVRALIKPMGDDELVIAQGQENNQRRDLSFIERARFAAVLENRGFPRSTIMAALDAHKSDLTRYIAITEALPLSLIEAIGPAPTTGRPSWMALAALMPPGTRLPASLKTLIASASFQALASDARFQAVLAALKGGGDKAPSPALQRWSSSDGALKAAVKVSGADGPAFAAFVAERLPDLHAAFRKAQTGDENAS